MIIKIEDFPIGKTIKHITIDITFDEDGAPLTKIKHDYAQPTSPEAPPYEVTSLINRVTETSNKPVDALPPANTVVTVSDVIMTSTSSIAHTQDSNIPDEMRNIQF